MLRTDFIHRKLQLIADELSLLEQFRDISYDDLVADPIKLAAVERMVERIVLRAIDINEHIIASMATSTEDRATHITYRETFLRLPGYGVFSDQFAGEIANSAGLRNILVHDYNDIDHHILHASIRLALSQYYEYVRAVHAFVAP